MQIPIYSSAPVIDNDNYCSFFYLNEKMDFEKKKKKILVKL